MCWIELGAQGMSGYDIAAWVVLIVVVIAGIVLSLVLAALPGRIARRRGHPWAEAVHWGGWLTSSSASRCGVGLDLGLRRCARPLPDRG